MSQPAGHAPSRDRGRAARQTSRRDRARRALFGRRLPARAASPRDGLHSGRGGRLGTSRRTGAAMPRASSSGSEGTAGGAGGGDGAGVAAGGSGPPACQAATTGGLRIEARARFGFRAALGSADDPRMRPATRGGSSPPRRGERPKLSCRSWLHRRLGAALDDAPFMTRQGFPARARGRRHPRPRPHGKPSCAKRPRIEARADELQALRELGTCVKPQRSAARRDANASCRAQAVVTPWNYQAVQEGENHARHPIPPYRVPRDD